MHLGWINLAALFSHTGGLILVRWFGVELEGYRAISGFVSASGTRMSSKMHMTACETKLRTKASSGGGPAHQTTSIITSVNTHHTSTSNYYTNLNKQPKQPK